MSLTGKIMDFFADKAMTIPAFPRTKVKAVSDDNNVGLDAILDNKSDKGHSHSASEVGALSTSGGQMNGSLNMNNNIIWNLARPVAGDQAANKQYVDDAASQKLHKAGDSMEGDLNMNGHVIWGLSNPTGYDQPVTYRMHVDDLAGKLPISGGTMTGLLKLAGSAMRNFDSPSVVATYINNNSSEGLGYANTGSLSVGYASSAGNADTLDGKHASDFIPGATTNWLPKHGMTFAELPVGFFAYSVNPGNCLSVGFPSGLSQYGTVFGTRTTEYLLLMYVDVFGNLAAYNTNEGYWRTIGSDKLSTSGGTMSGDINMGAHNIYGVNALFGTSGTYGTSLPAAGNPGRIFFKKVSG